VFLCSGHGSPFTPPTLRVGALQPHARLGAITAFYLCLGTAFICARTLFAYGQRTPILPSLLNDMSSYLFTCLQVNYRCHQNDFSLFYKRRAIWQRILPLWADGTFIGAEPLYARAGGRSGEADRVVTAGIVWTRRRRRRKLKTAKTRRRQNAAAGYEKAEQRHYRVNVPRILARRRNVWLVDSGKRATGRGEKATALRQRRCCLGRSGLAATTAAVRGARHSAPRRPRRSEKHVLCCAGA